MRSASISSCGGAGPGASHDGAAPRAHNPRLSDSRRGGPTPEMAMPAVTIKADGRTPTKARRRPPRRWSRVRPAAPLDPDRRQRLESLPAVRLRAPRLPLRPGAVAPSAPARVRIRTRRRLPERRPANGSDCKPLSLPTLLPPRTRRLVQTTPAWSGALRRSGCSQTPILVRSRVPTRPLRTAAARRRPRRGGQRRAPAPSRVAAARPIVLMNRRSTCG